ncbi:MAG: hypothetical protein HYX67_10675 [Candidatus Melainabacteria bacterium]|nr:hypothetical protein [Candidatus Melainabacteria bacterium]
MRRHTVFLFGEAEKGDFCTPMFCKSLPQLAETFGNPPEESLGLLYAVQALMFERDLIFFRVKEEGFSVPDYMRGIRMLKNKEAFQSLSAICMPGVGDSEIIEAASPICSLYKSFLITTERDLYDFLTAVRESL